LACPPTILLGLAIAWLKLPSPQLLEIALLATMLAVAWAVVLSVFAHGITCAALG
jgi:hypothetical protein